MKGNYPKGMETMSDTNAKPEATLKEVRDTFGMSSGDFARDWKKLSEQDKKDLRQGIGDGTLTY
jgi:hypothetical protein